MPNADVFISYKRDQRDEVMVVAERLQELGLSVWFDARLEAGTSFDEEINREVRGAKCVFVCWSPDAISSRWVRAEASIGLERDVLVAAFLRPTELIPPYNLVHTANLEGWDGTQTSPAWQDMLGRIGRLTGKPDLPTLAKAKGLEAQWVQQDQTARAAFEAKVAEARKRFSALHQSRPAAFEQNLQDIQGAFEAWILRRRTGDAGSAPDPLLLVEDQVEALRSDLEVAQRERDAAHATLMRERERATSGGNAGGASSPKAPPQGPKSVLGAAWRSLTVLIFGPIALALWGMRRAASIYLLIFLIGVPAILLSSCAQPTEAAYDPYDACFSMRERAWVRNYFDDQYETPIGGTFSTEAEASTPPQETGVPAPAATPAAAIEIPTDYRKTCGYSIGEVEGRSDGRFEGENEGRQQSGGIFIAALVGLNFVFSLWALFSGVGIVSRARKLAKMEAV